MAFLAIFRMNKYKNMQDFRAFMHKILHNGAPSGTRTLGPLIKSQFPEIFKIATSLDFKGIQQSIKISRFIYASLFSTFFTSSF